MFISENSQNQVQDIFKGISTGLLQDLENTSPYEEEPVDIKTFITSPKYLNASNYVYPVVQQDLEGIFAGNYTEAVLLEGIGSGKSFFAGLAVTYMVYRTLCLKDPQSYYPSLSPGSKITFMNMSTSATQAKKIVFGRIASMVRNCPWFQERGYLPDPKKTSELEFPKNIYVLPGSSSETAPLGYDLLGAVLDEAAFMVDTKSSNKASAEGGYHSVAEEIFDALKRRIESRFLNKGLIIVISSPRYKGDFISLKYEEAKTNSEVYARRRATFDCKPKSFYCGKRFIIDLETKAPMMTQDGSIIFTDDSNRFYKNKQTHLTIPIEHLTSFKRNFTKTLRDYCAIASRAIDPYIINYKHWVEIAEKSQLKHPYANGRFAEWFKGNDRISYVHVDLATGKAGRDACGIVLVCIDPESGKIQVPFMESLRALEGGEIQFSQVRELITTLRTIGFDIRLVTYDGWNSIDSRQILEKQGFTTEYLSVDRTMEPYETFKEAVNMGKVDFYAHPIFLEEIEGLELVEGSKVDHGPSSSKDCTDGVSGAIYTLITHPPDDVTMWVG